MLRRLLLFLGLTFAWSWGWWSALIALGGEGEVPFARLLTHLGAFGPAVGGVVALRLTSTHRNWGVGKVGFLFGVGLALVALLINYLIFTGDVFSQPGRSTPLNPETFTSAPGLVLSMAIVLVSGYIFGSIGSPDRTVAAYFKGLRPNSQTLQGAALVLLIFPAVLMTAHALERLMGGEPPPPYVFTTSPINWLPAMTFGLISVAALTGGNEEHGWRGVMQPVLHSWFSPLVAALIILLFWDAWHFPLHVAGIYGEFDGNLWAIFVGRLPSMLLLAIVLAAIYQASRGSVLLCVLFHACANTQISFFAGNSGQLYPILVGTLLALGLVWRFKLWRRDGAFHPKNSH